MQAEYRYRFFGTMRFLLALMVAISHLQETQLPEFLRGELVLLGRTGVYLFFIISGFVIAEALAAFYDKRPGAFLYNRFLRIFPSYFVALGLVWMGYAWIYYQHLPISGVGYDYYAILKPDVLWHNIFAVFDNSVALAKNHYYVHVAPIWSLVVEWQFYLVAAIVYATCGLWKSGQYRMYALAAVLFAMYGVSFMSTGHGIAVFSFSHFFLLGALAYIYRCVRSSFSKFGILCLIGFMGTQMVSQFYRSQTPFSVIASMVIGFGAIWVLAYLSTKATNSQTLRRVDVALGSLSYPLFLNHGTAQLLFYAYAPEPSWYLLALGVALSITISIVAYSLTEPVLYRLRDRIRGQKLERAS